MKFEELSDEQISKMSDIYWNRDLTWDQRMKSLSDLIGKSERTIQKWISKSTPQLGELSLHPQISLTFTWVRNLNLLM